jgi:hypothetical protein
MTMCTSPLIQSSIHLATLKHVAHFSLHIHYPSRLIRAASSRYHRTSSTQHPIMHLFRSLTVLLSAASLTLTSPLEQNKPEQNLPSNDLVKQTTDYLLHTANMTTFQLARANKKGPSELDWSSDGCSGPVIDKKLFRPSCERHDFGYRNYKKQGRCGKANRWTIDGKFYHDMNQQCSDDYTWKHGKKLVIWICWIDSVIYWLGVRIGGGKSFC